ncbi:MAG: T9SS type A sorting domain-containing protein [Candidatus Kapabacteria bacterium]|nr:T9SS type A sorting domain-containing protein [Candidatus Kapabacteria bacterium]
MHILIALFFLVGTAMGAAPIHTHGYRHDDAHHARSMEPSWKGAVAPLRAELRAWFQNHVAPSLREWQAQYDASLSAEDRATLQELRKQAAALRSLPHGQRREQRRQLASRVRPILERSRDVLVDIMDDHRATIDGWHNTVRNIVGSWQQQHPSMKPPRHALGLEMRGPMAVVRFVLWDGTIPPVPDEHDGTHGNALAKPSGGDVLTDGVATIDLYDMNGALMGSQSGTISGGRLSTPISTAGLPQGQYMATIRDATGRRQMQLVR